MADAIQQPKLQHPSKVGVSLLVVSSASLRLLFGRPCIRYLYREVLADPKAMAFALLCWLQRGKDPIFVWYVLDLLLQVPEHHFDDKWIAVVSLPLNRIHAPRVHERIRIAHTIIRDLFGLWKVLPFATKTSIDSNRSCPKRPAEENKIAGPISMNDLAEYQDSAMVEWAIRSGIQLSMAASEREEFARRVLEAAKADDPEAQFLLSALHGQGYDFRLNSEEAFDWLRKSAIGGSNIALCTLGYLYVLGIGVEKDLLKGKSLIAAAAAKGFPPATRAMSVLDV